MHISKRDTISLSKAWSIRAIAILLALIVDGIIIYAIVKMNPLKVYVSLASGAFGTSKRMWFTIRDCMILTCIAIGLAPAFKMRFWNVGAEGQMLVGGIATAFWMINFAGKMNIVMLFLCMAISAIVAGGIWGLIPGFFKAKWNTNETLFTLMISPFSSRRSPSPSGRTLQDRTPSAPSTPRAMSSTSAGSAICSPTAITRTSCGRSSSCSSSRRSCTSI